MTEEMKVAALAVLVVTCFIGGNLCELVTEPDLFWSFWGSATMVTVACVTSVVSTLLAFLIVRH